MLVKIVHTNAHIVIKPIRCSFHSKNILVLSL